MKQTSWKFFVGVGILLTISGAYVYRMDDIVGVIGVLFGLYNLYKGIRLAKGIQPYFIRKQRENLEKDQKELKDKVQGSSKRNNRNNKKQDS